ncbi:GGDEF domain-containing protein [Petrocella sp. FN5]|uniref:GGDEF domain-containing protein n=1 Tax=Petrocella sp. FN5 TaxID=3032002 RepID=UPI0023DB0A4C|nr:GGDEF domain-containing protein [Petrocella sp. FN5]MDF1618572.1 GGDEF domain-containing protein [Petrocella sp. FN5]
MHKKKNIETQRMNSKINENNIAGLRTIVLVILTIVTIQTIVYLSVRQISFGLDIVGIKIALIFLGCLLLFSFAKIKTTGSFFMKYSEVYIGGIVIIILGMSILNTFFAQDISSDISIYILVLFSVISAVRIRPRTISIILLISYSFFAIGLPFFQSNMSFLVPHLINGLVINIIAFFISRMLYLYAVTYLDDKAEIEKKNEELKYLSERDALTGLYNQRMINTYIEKYTNQAELSGENLFLGVIDLDGFKKINDHYGHAFGDKVLCRIANIIKDNLPTAEFVGRYGGDEFVLMFKNLETNEVSAIMENVLIELNKVEFHEDKLSFSCGIAKWQGESTRDFFYRADSYMYKIKNSGKNGVLINDDEKEAV